MKVARQYFDPPAIVLRGEVNGPSHAHTSKSKYCVDRRRLEHKGHQKRTYEKDHESDQNNIRRLYGTHVLARAVRCYARTLSH